VTVHPPRPRFAGTVVGFLTRHPMATAVLYVMTGALPLYLVSAQFAALERELALTAARLGLVTSVYFGVAAAVAAPVGRVVHRLGAQKGLRAGALVSATASLVAMSSGDWRLLFAATALSGVANAFMQVSTNVVLARDASFERQGLSFGAKQGAVPLSSMVAGLLLPVLGVAVGWRWPFAFACIGAVAVAFVAPPVSPAPSSAAATDGDSWSPSTSLRWLAVGGACGGAAGNALSLFFVPSAVRVGITEGFAGTALAVGSGLVVVIRLIAGWIADRTGSTGHREMVVALGTGTAGCVLLAAADTPAAFYGAIAIALLGSWGWPGLAYFTVVRIHPEAPARASGVVLAGNLTGTLLGPIIVGMLAREGSFTSAWVFCAALSAVATTSIAISWRAARARRVVAR
jgi:MFS family permease